MRSIRSEGCLVKTIHLYAVNQLVKKFIEHQKRQLNWFYHHLIQGITYQGAKSVTFYSTVTFLTFFGLLTNKNSNTQGLCHFGTVSFSLTQQRTIQASVKLTALFCTLPLNVPWPIKLGHRALCKVVQQRYPLKVYLNKLNSFEALFCQLLLPLLSRPRANYFPPWTRIRSDTKFRVSKYYH